MESGKHHIVIGGGISGATAALLLAKHDHKVSLVEKSPRLCPTLRGFWKNGVYFDTGLHYTGELGKGGVLDTYFRYLGIDGLEPIPLDPLTFDTIRFSDGQKVALPCGSAALASALNDAFPKEQKAIETYLDNARQVFADSNFLNFSVAGVMQEMQNPLWHQSLEVFLSGLTDNENLKTVLSIHCLLHGVAPNEVPFLHHARVSASYYRSAHTIAGGGKALADRMEQRLQEEGITLHCGKAANRILFSPAGSITGVALADGTQLAGSNVVYTAHPHYLPDLLPDNALRPGYKKRLKELRESVSAYILFGATHTLPAILQRKNLFLCQSGEPLSLAFAKERPPERGPFYVTASHFAHSDALRGQPGSKESGTKIGVEAFAPGWLEGMDALANSTSRKRTDEYKQFKASTMNRFRDALLATCPELEEIDFFDGATPLTLRDYLHSPCGGMYGAAHTVDQFNPLPVTRIPELLLAGQAVVAPGILGAVVSAFLACSFIIGLEKLKGEVAAWHQDG